MVYFGDRQRDRNRDRSNQKVERIIHDEEFGEENVELVDSEWADFEKFICQLRKRRNSAMSMEEELRHVQRQPKIKSHAFYPCPPPAENARDSDSSDEDDPIGYIDTLVSIYGCTKGSEIQCCWGTNNLLFANARQKTLICMSVPATCMRLL